MNRFRNLLAAFAFSLLILGLPALASAQWRDDDDYNRNNRNGDYRNNRNYNRGNLRSAINRLANRAESFERRLDRELDNSRYDNRNREDRLNRLANDFTRAAERLEDEFDGGRNIDDSYDEAQRVLNLAQQIDNAMSRSRMGGSARGEWNSMRQDLNTIANAYGYNNRNRNRRGGSGNWRDYLPF
jgi:chromosome segregation ATPase